MHDISLSDFLINCHVLEDETNEINIEFILFIILP